MKKITFLCIAMLAYCWQSNAQDTCSTATPVTPGAIIGTTITQDSAGGQGDTFTTRNSAWFAYTATGDGTIDISSCEGGEDTRLYIFDDCAGAAIANNDDTCAVTVNGNDYAAEISELAVTNGTTYYIEWDDRWSGLPFDWSLTFTPAPICTQAVIDSSTTVESCNTDGTGTFTVDHIVSSAGDAGTVLDDGTNTYPLEVGTVTTGPYNSGDSVTVELRGTDSDCDFTVGSFEFTCPAPPPTNVDCASATPIACDETIAATSDGSTGTSEDIGCATIGDNGIWFTFVGTGGDMTVSVDADFDHRLAIASGSCGSLVNIACNDQSFGTEVHTFPSVLDEAYYVYVAHFESGNTTTGLIDITLTCAVVPACTQAVIDSSTIVESCNPDGTGMFTIDHVVSNAGDAETVLDDGTNTYPLEVGTVTTGPYNSGDSVTVELTGTDPDCDFTVGTFEFTCPLPAPANDDLANATPIACGNTYVGNTTLATIDEADAPDVATIEEDTSADVDSPNVWFSFVGTGDIITLSTCSNTDFDSELFVFTGSSGALTCIDDGYDECGSAANFAAETTFTSTLGTQYWISVEGYDVADVGTFELEVNCTPPPTCIPATFLLAEGENSCPTDGGFSIEVAVSELGTSTTVNILQDGVAVFAGVDGIASPYIIEGLLSETDYEITVEDAEDSTCFSTQTFTTDVCPPPAPDNDNFANATPVSCGNTYAGDTTNATIDEADAPDVATIEVNTSADTDSPNVWFSFVGTGEVVTLSTCLNTEYDSEIFVFTGSSGDLTCIDDGYDECGSAGNFAAETSFTSILGTQYWISVEGFNFSSVGAFELTVSCEAVCTPPTFTLSLGGILCPDDLFSINLEVSDLGTATTFNILRDGVVEYTDQDGSIDLYTFANLPGDTTYEFTVEDAVTSTCASTQTFTTDVCPPPAPANDDISGAINLPVGETLCETVVNATNVGATDSLEEEGASCGTPEGDVWFKVTVPSTGNLTLEASSADVDSITDTVITVYSGTSGSLVEIACDDDGGAGLFSLIELTGLNPGDELMVRVWEFGDDTKGNFNICAWSPTSLGLEDNSFYGFSFYPNPVSDVLSLNATEIIESVELFNVIGQRIMSINSNETIQNVNMAELQSGTYFVKVLIANQIKVIKVIKE